MSTPPPDTEAPTLTGERVALRPIRSTDAVALHAMYGDPDAMRFWTHPVHLDLERTREVVEAKVASMREGRAMSWAIARPAAPQAVGQITLFDLHLQNERAEIGFGLSRRLWGQGLVSEAQRLVLAHAFEVLGLHRIEAYADPRNEASVRALERQGFRREGLLRERWLIAGERSDDACFGLLAHEWAGRPAAP